jgi:rod shape determining protein RodA
MIQPDAGSALVFISFLFLLYRNGMSPLIGIFIISFAFLFIISLMFDINYIIIGLLLGGVATLMLSFNKKLWYIIGLIIAVAASIIGFYFSYYDITFIGLAILSIVFAFIHFRNRKPRLAFFIITGLILSISFSYSSFYAFNNFLKPHQQERLNVWLNPEKCDPRGALYNVLQSKMAIGSGGWTGKGFTNGILTKLNYIPEQSTDFIFCTVGEEHGFIGGLVLISLFVWLLIRLIQLAERQRSIFSRNYMYGIAGILFFHFFINLGMTIGVMPIIGIPLPFVSYGGSSLISFSTMVAIVLKMDSQRSAA